MNDKFRDYQEYFRTEEYNDAGEYYSKRNILSAEDSVTGLSFDETTHRKNSYASSLNVSSRRDKQKSTNQIVALSAAGTVSIIAVVAVIVAAVAGISFVSYSSTDTSLACIVDIPEDMDGVLVGVLYDIEGNEVSRYEVSGTGKQKFLYDGLPPETDFYFSIFDNEEKQYLYESVSTVAGTRPTISALSAEYYPYAVKIPFNIYNPVSATLEVVLIYDESSGGDRESFRMPEDGVITARNENAEIVRVIVQDQDETRYFDVVYALPFIEYAMLEDSISTGADYASASVLIQNPSACELFVSLIDSETGSETERIPVTDGTNDISFTGLQAAIYSAILTDGLGQQYLLGEFYVGTTETR